MTPLRVAIVGAGLMGRWHSAEARHAGAKVVAVVDVNLARAKALAGHGATVGATLEAALQQPADVVHVCTPPETHLAVTRAALAAGCHVVLEKPATRTVAEARSLQTAADAAGRLLVPVHQFVFQRGVQQILAARSRLGPLRHVEFATCSAGADGPEGRDRDQVAAEISPHAFSLARAVLGLEVGTLKWKLERAVAGEWRFSATTSGGCTVSNLISLSARPTFARLQVLGERASAHADLFHGFSVLEPGTSSRQYKVGRPLAVGVKGLAAASENLTRRLLEREPAYPGLRELFKRTYAAISGGPRPFRSDELVDVAQAVARLEGQL